jgi:hypothetical protein
MITAATRNARLPLETMYDFCLKACAIYITAPLGPGALTQSHLIDIFDYFYERMDREAALADDTMLRAAFPCKFLACWAPNSPRAIAEIVDMHQAICSQIHARQTVLDAEDALAPGANPSRHEEYRLHPLFRALFIVMDRSDWHEHEVQLIRTGDDEELCGGPIDFDPLRFAFWVDDEGDVLRGSFKRVMALVVDWKHREDDAQREQQPDLTFD